MNASETDHSHDGTGGPVTNRAHPRIYTIVAGLCAWFVLMAWNFATGGFVDYLLVIVSGFMFVAIALTLILFSVGGNKKNGTTPGNVRNPPLRDWVGWDYETRTGRIRGAQSGGAAVATDRAVVLSMSAPSPFIARERFLVNHRGVVAMALEDHKWSTVATGQPFKSQRARRRMAANGFWCRIVRALKFWARKLALRPKGPQID